MGTATCFEVAAIRLERDGGESMVTRSRSATIRVALVVVGLAIHAVPIGTVPRRNAGKYGAMFSWWYEDILPQTLYPPTLTWDARNQAWWNAIVRQADEAGLGWLAAACWGQGTTADPVTVAPLLRAIDAARSPLKIALFDDTTSEVLRKNEAKGYGWSLDVRFDLTDLAGRGEGGLAYFYEQQWKRFFETVPARYRLEIDGRPVVFMWHGGEVWYANQQAFHGLIDALRRATERDFGVDPFVIPEESWARLDPDLEPDALYDWFEPGRNYATLTAFGGFRVGHLVPGYDCSRCTPPGPIIDRQGGALFTSAMDAIAPGSDLVLIEGLVNIDENAHLVETTTWGRRYIDLMRWYAQNMP
jgi:hypothetical protein